MFRPPKNRRRFAETLHEDGLTVVHVSTLPRMNFPQGECMAQSIFHTDVSSLIQLCNALQCDPAGVSNS